MKFDEYKREGSEVAVKAAGGYRSAFPISEFLIFQDFQAI